MQCKCCYGEEPCHVRFGLWVQFPPLGLEDFFFLSFLTLTALRAYRGVCASVGRVLRVYLTGLTLTLNIPLVVYLDYGSPANFQFLDPIASINISKESQCYGDHSGPIMLQIDLVILKLSRFSQVQSECERT